MGNARMRMAAGQGGMSVAGVALISAGITQLERGNVVPGAIMALLGSVLLVLANYVGR